jgi:hypothetical protein
MKVYWWRRTGAPQTSVHLIGPPIQNFGDQINEFVLKQLGVDYDWALPESADLILGGSILEHLPEHWAGTVCGAGKLHESARVNLSDARVYALRGKLTLNGISLPDKGSVVLGDPGLLLPLWVRQQPHRYPIGVLPHHADNELWQRFSYGHLIDPRQSVYKVAEEIGACRRLITSSLHGAVVADAYQVPRQLEQPPDPTGKEGGTYKFRDYATLYDNDPHFGEIWTAPRNKVEKIQADLLAALKTAAGIDLGADQRNPQVSLLVPFRDDGEHRARVWRWLRSQWRQHYPEAEIIMGTDDSDVFCKSAAVNDAALRARGRTFVLLDADAWLAPAVLTRCADLIDAAAHRSRQAWFMPYSTIHRLSHEKTLEILDGEQNLTLPPPDDWCEDIGSGQMSLGHSFGALAQVLPRQAFELVEGMDDRFREGWGGEDGSFLRSVDTLWQQHEVAPGSIAHLWHMTHGKDWRDRKWVGQTRPNANARLSNRYTQATSTPGAMRALCDEHPLRSTE